MDQFNKDRIRQMKTAEKVKKAPGGLEKWVGMVVKKGFPLLNEGSLEQEFMFVEIVAVEDSRLRGRLLNRPVYATYLKQDDMVSVDEEDIYGAEYPSWYQAKDGQHRTNA